MILNIQDDILKLQSLGLLDKLLLDKTTGKRIMWATDAYAALGPRYGRNEEITPELITGPNASVIKTRARKELEQKSSRTRQHGEVSTPLWVCRKMCGYADEMWDSKDRWQKYVDARVLEITCGEAPFLVSRYDVETGEVIPVPDRIGLLDRKLRTVNENAQTEEDWLKWAFRALHATYGYEFQGDNLLIARVNLLMTFEEYLWERWRRKPTFSEYGKLITVIVWNVWQMDGLHGIIPYSTAEEEFQQFNLFEFLDGMSEPDEENKQPRCRVYNWLGGGIVEYSALPTRGKRAMKFDFVIGNPPYQDETLGENKGYAPPIYHLFLDGAYEVADKVELIHPARFLFNAGSTPKSWNQKMLSDPHLKVLHYEQDASRIFANTEIKGGVAITYHDENEDYGAIGTFTPFDELNTIIHKIHYHPSFESLSVIVVTSYAYHFTEAMHKDHPEAASQLSKGHAYDLKSNVFERIPQVFFDIQPQDGQKYIQILGRKGNDRVYKYIREDYINNVINLHKYKIYLPKANGAGALGEVLSPPVLAEPGTGSTETFLSIGAFETEEEAQATLKYIKTKFARIMLGVLKTTQDITPQKWEHVPLQNFAPASDIDWTKSIPEIDQQLYKKYGLDKTEIQFIETHVREMT
ncbi:MAG: restriction endonuclease [Oscillospiraceae bacterium]|nr:restriction endonuclease [Oscillospiraceae bacterium]